MRNRVRFIIRLNGKCVRGFTNKKNARAAFVATRIEKQGHVMLVRRDRNNNEQIMMEGGHHSHGERRYVEMGA